ncbi:hypothetical protein B0H13DRAFT_1864585 [Mycena leptocephala]|nr:hypothetical protein B0H13DRAFT_1864585 [Mycena leptocephala]
MATVGGLRRWFSAGGEGEGATRAHQSTSRGSGEACTEYKEQTQAERGGHRAGGHGTHRRGEVTHRRLVLPLCLDGPQINPFFESPPIFHRRRAKSRARIKQAEARSKGGGHRIRKGVAGVHRVEHCQSFSARALVALIGMKEPQMGVCTDHAEGGAVVTRTLRPALPNLYSSSTAAKPHPRRRHGEQYEVSDQRHGGCKREENEESASRNSGVPDEDVDASASLFSTTNLSPQAPKTSAPDLEEYPFSPTATPEIRPRAREKTPEKIVGQTATGQSDALVREKRRCEIMAQTAVLRTPEYGIRGGQSDAAASYRKASMAYVGPGGGKHRITRARVRRHPPNRISASPVSAACRSRERDGLDGLDGRDILRQSCNGSPSTATVQSSIVPAFYWLLPTPRCGFPSYTVVRFRPTPASSLIMIHRSTTPPYRCAQRTAGEEQRAWVGGPVQVDMRPSRTGGGGMHVAQGMKEQNICKA